MGWHAIVGAVLSSSVKVVTGFKGASGNSKGFWVAG